MSVRLVYVVMVWVFGWLILLGRSEGLRLRVADDGCGFDVPALEDHPQADRLGLLGMHEQAALSGGLLKIRSALGKGTIVEAEDLSHPRFPTATRRR